MPAFSPDDRSLAAADPDTGETLVWDISPEKGRRRN
jgi:hypothetical protein